MAIDEIADLAKNINKKNRISIYPTPCCQEGDMNRVEEI